ncbi:DUF3105 domain-containing protein [Streptomyces sp. NBC_01498]|uniref:DUF3105 domain-containing protein n=1 Tax=Streptomyces sp. NBC_01498 TaxID=2975870 RepID=UPI002E7B9C4E|nr:DUF3105 domain-containing protein [Streptomyces sp. NBC_01498]WTL27193.1 DUF3105 domain-containing protein [Streptomyces sp. NBC_01498]
MASKTQSTERKARIEQMRRAERARERRNRIITITASAAVVVALVGFGAFVLNKESEEQKAQDKAAAAPVKGEKSWDAKKLGRDHVAEEVKYPQTPPVGGNHNQAWMNCAGDVYKEPVPNVNAVHSLEHGAVWVTYNDKASDGDVKTLGELVGKTQYSLMSPVKEQAGTVMLTAWGKQVTVDSADDPRVDQFLAKYVQGAQTPEPGAACTGGIGAQ